MLESIQKPIVQSSINLYTQKQLLKSGILSLSKLFKLFHSCIEVIE